MTFQMREYSLNVPKTHTHTNGSYKTRTKHIDWRRHIGENIYKEKVKTTDKLRKCVCFQEFPVTWLVNNYSAFSNSHPHTHMHHPYNTRSMHTPNNTQTNWKSTEEQKCRLKNRTIELFLTGMLLIRTSAIQYRDHVHKLKSWSFWQ